MKEVLKSKKLKFFSPVELGAKFTDNEDLAFHDSSEYSEVAQKICEALDESPNFKLQHDDNIISILGKENEEANLACLMVKFKDKHVFMSVALLSEQSVH